jgi:uncharacterized protein
MASPSQPQGIVAIATSNYQQPPPDWLRASHVKALIGGDPSVIWLEHFASTYGLESSHSEVDLSAFIFRKSREFEGAWCRNNCPTLERVCAEAYEVRTPAKVSQTFELMTQGVPVIGQAALWWAPERIYGAADLLVHTSWLSQRFPGLLSSTEVAIPAPNLGQGGKNGHYVVIDLKFKTKLDDSKNKTDREIYAAQLRLYSYMVGQLQGVMPAAAFVIPRDNVAAPYKFAVASQYAAPLDSDLGKLRDHFADIVKNGAAYLPWRDPVVKYVLGEDEKWSNAKKRMALEFFPGRDPQLVYNVSSSLAAHLASAGYPNLDSLLAVDPASLPIEQCKGYGGSGSKARPIRAVLEATRNNKAIVPSPTAVPGRRQYEYFIDFEYFTNINVDYEHQWPLLEGCEMIFMVGLGWHDSTGWHFQTFIAEAETHAAEAQMLNKLVFYLQEATNGSFTDPTRSALYHWSPAENWQCKRAADRHFPDPSHPLRTLPLVDLQKHFLATPCCFPGAFSFGLKDTANSLRRVAPELDAGWPGDLDEGSKAMVMGWNAYAKGDVQESTELKSLVPYLEADCRAVRNVLVWMRESALKVAAATP